MQAIEQLLLVMRRLRDPETGCAWDLEQTFSSIAPYTVEEAYEVADAIERGDMGDLRDELGDLLLQVVFHSQMAAEQDAFTFNDVAERIVAKLIRRHPHVFGNVSHESADDVKAAWEKEKARERAHKDAVDTSALSGIARTLPALLLANKMQARASRVGFDWPDDAPVWEKLSEEINETREAVEQQNNDAIENEVGDLLFTVVNLARHLNVNPETALHRSSRKFERRFRSVETRAQQQNVNMTTATPDELDAIWDDVKRLE